jgi:hypothetical protein
MRTLAGSRSLACVPVPLVGQLTARTPTAAEELLLLPPGGEFLALKVRGD